MSDDGREQRLDDVGQARELREAIAKALAESRGTLWNSLSEKIGTCDYYREMANALLSGPLAPLLAPVESIRAAWHETCCGNRNEDACESCRAYADAIRSIGGTP